MQYSTCGCGSVRVSTCSAKRCCTASSGPMLRWAGVLKKKGCSLVPGWFG